MNKKYIEAGFKAIRCKGYHSSHNSERDYGKAKEPIDTGFTQEGFRGMSLKEIRAWIAQEGWVGWVVPKGYIALDVERAYKISTLESICNEKEIKPSKHRSNNGKHYFFKLNEDLPGSSNIYTKSGLELTYRVGGKNYLILAPVNKREWEEWKPLRELPDLPEEFKPRDQNNKIEIIRAISYLLREAREAGSVNGFEDIDCAYMAFLVENGLSQEEVEEAFRLIFCDQYDEKRTADMFERASQRIEAGQKVIGTGSLIEKVRKSGLKKIEGQISLLRTETGGRRYFKGKEFVPKRLADELTEEHSFKFIGELLYVYHDGVYKPHGEEVIKRECRKKLGDGARSNHVREVIQHIIDLNRCDAEDMNKERQTLINVKNCMLNWRAGELLQHEERYQSTIQIPVEYNAEATCPEIDRFFNATLPPDCILLIEEIIGYCLIPDVRFEKAFILVGKGANGKSTFLNLLYKAFLGEMNVSTIPLQEICNHRFKRADLFGKLANIFTDIGSRTLMDSNYFKAIVSGDSIDAERKFGHPFNFKPHAKLLFSANEMPKSDDKTLAYYRRLIIVPFPNTFTGSNADRNLIPKLTTPEELSGLLNRALAGLRRLFENGGFPENETTREALCNYRNENDSISLFVTEKCEFGDSFEIERQCLLEAYERFCNDEGHSKEGKKIFYSHIRSLEQVTEQNRIFRGIRLKREPEETEDQGGSNIEETINDLELEEVC